MAHARRAILPAFMAVTHAEIASRLAWLRGNHRALNAVAIFK